MSAPLFLTHPVLTKVYPWDEHNKAFILHWLYIQASKTGFIGTFDDFKTKYGAYAETQEDIISYNGTYHITPLLDMEQILNTKNAILYENIVIDPIPQSLINTYQIYAGKYNAIPMVDVDQILRTKECVLEDDIIIEKIPYSEVSNTAGGTTVIIG